MKRVLLYLVLCLVSFAASRAQSTANPFVYVDANDQRQACLGIAGRDTGPCSSVSDFNDRQMCSGLAASSQAPCFSMTNRNLQLTCFGLAFAPNFPSNCRDITDTGLRNFCFSAASWGTEGTCSLVSDPADHALCQALTYRDSSYCAAIANANDRQFCLAVSVHDNSPCAEIAAAPGAGGPYTVNEGGSVVVTASGGVSYSWDLDNDGSFETTGQSATFSAAALDGPGSRTISVQVTASDGQTTTAQATVNITNVAPTATFNAPGTVNAGSAIDLSLTTPVDVDADQPTLEYAFDCGSGYGLFSASNSVSCPTPAGDVVVRGKVRDKDGGVSEYTASVTVNGGVVRPNPFSVPSRTDSTFVVDHAPDLDTGCSSSGDRSLTFTLLVDRVVGNRTKLLSSGLLAQTAVLKMPAYDIAFAGGNGVNPERDRVYFNGHLVPTEFLTGAGGTWKLNSFVIRTEWIEFPADPIANDPAMKGPLPPKLTPAVNTIRIDIDTGNTKTFSCTTIDWASLSISVVRPVLLVHGILSNHETWEDVWIPGLQSLGLPVSAVDVGKLGSIQDNSSKIRDRVDQLQLLWGIDRLSIGSHSKGGLDSRHYIENHDEAATLVQIGTPNAGSPLASLVQRGLTSIPVIGDILVVIIDVLFPAAYQLTPEYMSVYNSFHGRNPRTVYISLAGDYRFGGFFGGIPNGILRLFYGGPSDLVVPVWSVHSLAYSRHLLYQTKGSNKQSIHIKQTKSPDIHQILKPVLSVPSSALPAPQITAGLLASPEPLLQVGEDPAAGSIVSTRTIVGKIMQGETKTETLYMDGTQPIALTLYHGTGELGLALISPSGVRIDPATAAGDPNVDFESLVEGEGLHVLMYGIDTPEAGTWTLEVSAPSVVNPSGQEPYFLTGILTDTTIHFEATTDRSAYHRGDPVIVHATFRDGAARIPGAQVTAYAVGPDQSVASLTLTDDGNGDDPVANDGIYSGRFSSTAHAGLYQILVEGTGPTERPFTREDLLLVPVSASTSRLNGLFSDAGDDTDADGLFNDLVVEVGMDVTEPRSYRMLGELADADGTLIATATAEANLNAGAETVSLRFDGASIYKHGVDGLYDLKVVRVAEEDGSAILPLDERQNAYTTGSYDHRQFQHPALAALDQDVTTQEDSAVDLTLGAESSDPVSLSFRILADPSHGLLSGTAPNLTYTPEPDFNGSDLFTFVASNGTDDSEPATVIVTVNPVNDPPVLAPIPDHGLDEGTTAQITVSASDLDGDDLKLTMTGAPAFATLVDNGDDTGRIVLPPGFNAAGIYHPTVTVSDGSSSDTTTFTLTVNNVNRPPVAHAGGPYAGNEGDPITFSATLSTDPDADGTITHYEWDLDNDGAYDATGVTTTTVFGDQGTYVVGLRVTDDQGAQATVTVQVAVANVAPAVGSISAPVAPVAVNATVSVSATFTDPGVRDTHTAVWDWNDGSTSAGTILGTGSAKSVTGTHIYTAAGVYTVKLTVTDKDGGAGTVSHQYVVVYDPDGAFVTGGGWVTSPAGAYPADPALTGRVNFGFVSKYKTGQAVPTGQTQLQFQVANLSFHSETYEWLVVSGARAQYKGVGQINGTGSYGFLITAIDGQSNGGGGSDKLRVKIWDRASGRIVYDNQIGAADNANPATSIQGGSIVIHSH